MKHHRQLLLARAKKLVSMLEADLPDAIVAMQATLVWRAAWRVSASAMGAALAEWIHRTALAESGCCLGCERPIDVRLLGATHCNDCISHAEVENLKFDLYLQPPGFQPPETP